MNVFQKYTLASLRKNRVRTTVTLIGIILSMAMLTAVTQGAQSGLNYLVRSETAQVGAFHGFWCEVDQQDVASLTQAKGIKRTATWRRVGFAQLSEERYLQIESLPEDLGDMVSVKLSAGRMPENEHELLIPSDLSQYADEPMHVGDTVTLASGERMLDGEYLNATAPYTKGETLENLTERTYTVVGIYERLDYVIRWNVSESACSCIALTVGAAQGRATVFYTVDRPTAFYDVMYENMKSGILYSWTPHSDLLTYSGSFRNGNLTKMLYGLVAVLLALIAFGSISLIYNSFSISVNERTRQFGILKSVGATKKQLRGAVLFEALILCAVAIPVGAFAGCTGIGITLWCLRDSFSNLLDSGSAVQMKLAISWQGLAISALSCLAVALISAWVPAKRAMSVSPITAIRQADDFKISEREVRVSRVTKKLFGFEGVMAAKNFKRNRKRYRSTVVSLFLSVTLFISASSFCYYLTESVDSVGSEANGADLSLYIDCPDRTPEKLCDLISSADAVRRVLYESSAAYDLQIPQDLLSEAYLELYADRAVDSEIGLSICFLADDAYLSFCRENGIDGERYLRAEEPMALLYNQGVCYREVGTSDYVWSVYTLLRADGTRGTYRSVSVRSRWNELYYFGMRNDSGEYLYFTETDYAAYKSAQSGEEREEILSRATAVSADQAETVTEFTLGGTIDAVPFGFSSERPFLLYPYSRGEEVCNCDLTEYGVSFYVEAPDHGAAYESLKGLLLQAGVDSSNLVDLVADREAMRSTVTVVNVFSYGFIVLISLIAVANVFNTISTNVALRRREFAMMKSVGLTARGLRKMLNYECLIYGSRGLALGLPVSFLATVAIWRIVGQAVQQPFKLPWNAIAIAVCSVFAVVFATMLYAMHKLRGDDPVETLKNENL